MGNLSARAVATAKSGRHGDGAGLWLVVALSGAKKWVYRFSFLGKVTEMGLGSAATVTLAQARERAQTARLSVSAGINPIATKAAIAAAAMAPAIPSFGAVAIKVFEAKSSVWRSPVHRQQWLSSLKRYAAAIWDLPIDQIGDAAARNVLLSTWAQIPTTAPRVRGRCEEVWNFARVHGWVTGNNPFQWRGNVEHILPRRLKVEQAHFSAMNYRDIPAFVKSLRQEVTIPRLCLEFLILVAGRSSKVRFASWPEIDTSGKVWTIPAHRIKSGTSHRIPLAERNIEILNQARRSHSGLVFPGRIGGHPLSPTTLMTLLPSGFTLHGLRSSFRDFCAEQTHYPREVCEEALSHNVGSAVERAYRRTDLLERRRALMESWAAYCEPGAATNVVSIGAGKR